MSNQLATPTSARVVAADAGARITAQLRVDILSGRLPEGAPLREVLLAKRFEASRGRIREVLRQLEHEGLVVAKANCGVRVAPAPPDAIQELTVPLRQTLESFALRSIYYNLEECDFAAWEGILEAMKTACEKVDYPAIAENDLAFHRSIVERAGQPDLLSMWTTMVSRLRRHLLDGHRQYDDPMKIYYEHAAVVAMFRTGNLEGSIGALNWNIE